MRLHTSIATFVLAALASLSLPGDVQAGGYPYYGFPPRRLESARARGMGALELHVKPGKAEVFVDEHFAGKAGDFDGSPTLLWLKKGTHKIRISLEGYETFSEDYRLAPGEVFEVHLKLKK